MFHVKRNKVQCSVAVLAEHFACCDAGSPTYLRQRYITEGGGEALIWNRSQQFKFIVVPIVREA
jgi:hypothetical protein